MKFNRILTLVILSWVLSGHAQHRELLYDFTEVPQAILLNPGSNTGMDWYAGLPMLSGTSVYAGTSGLSVNDLFADDGLDFNDKVRNRAIYGMGIRDEISTNYQIEVLSAGFRAKNHPQNFYSFGIYHETDFIQYWPKDLGILAFDGNAGHLGEKFNLGHLKTRGEMLNVFHFGLNRQVSHKLVVGARAKLYSGIFDFNSTGNKGYFLTETGQNNLLANTLVADMKLRTSGLEALRKVLDDDTVDDASGLRRLMLGRGFLGGDLGMGIDLGFTYYLDNQLVLTGSVLDLGFIYHHTDPRNFTLEGSATVEGVEVILPDALDDPGADFWQDLVDEIEELVPFEENTRGYVTFRPTRLYGSLRYNFGHTQQAPVDCDCDYGDSQGKQRFLYANSVGGQLFVINRPRGPQAAVTAFYQRRFGNLVSLKTTYTADKFSLANLGLGLNVQAGPVNFYVMADNLLGYSNIPDMHYTSFLLGLNILSWGGNPE
jgi:hypothetical protein